MFIYVIILRTILTQIQKPDTLAVMDNYNFCDIQTDMVKNSVGGDKHIDRYTHTRTLQLLDWEKTH